MDVLDELEDVEVDVLVEVEGIDVLVEVVGLVVDEVEDVDDVEVVEDVDVLVEVEVLLVEVDVEEGAGQKSPGTG